METNKPGHVHNSSLSFELAVGAEILRRFLKKPSFGASGISFGTNRSPCVSFSASLNRKNTFMKHHFRDPSLLLMLHYRDHYLLFKLFPGHSSIKVDYPERCGLA